jgi:hypothetical protein
MRAAPDRPLQLPWATHSVPIRQISTADFLLAERTRVSTERKQLQWEVLIRTRGALRYARQRLGVVPRLVPRQLQWSADRRECLAKWWRAEVSGVARRLVGDGRLPSLLGVPIQTYPILLRRWRSRLSCGGGCANSVARYVLVPFSKRHGMEGDLSPVRGVMCIAPTLSQFCPGSFRSGM